MRDYYLVLVLVAVAICFLVNPEPLKTVEYWLGIVVR